MYRVSEGPKQAAIRDTRQINKIIAIIMSTQDCKNAGERERDYIIIILLLLFVSRIATSKEIIKLGKAGPLFLASRTKLLSLKLLQKGFAGAFKPPKQRYAILRSLYI